VAHVGSGAMRRACGDVILSTTLHCACKAEVVRTRRARLQAAVESVADGQQLVRVGSGAHTTVQQYVLRRKLSLFAAFWLEWWHVRWRTEVLSLPGLSGLCRARAINLY
jgi:hypothetical protein